MAHVLILGMTQSGKSTLAKALAQKYKTHGIGVLVNDPLGDPTWPADYRTSEVDEFLEQFWASRGCAAFIDEAGDCAGTHDKDMVKTATRGRHWGHRCHYISQRGTMIARSIRDQCTGLFLFCTALEDCKVHAAEWNCPELLEAAKFKQGDFFHVTRFGQLTRSNIFNKPEVQKNAGIDTANESSNDDRRPSNSGRKPKKLGYQKTAISGNSPT
jgi:energy-coupling factor transporter ATP-binding protein EcfA2